MAFLLLHSECGHKLHSTCIAHAEDIECPYLDCADICTGVALRIGSNVGQVNAIRRGRQSAHGIAESMIREGSGQCDVGRSAGHKSPSRPGRITRGLPMPLVMVAAGSNAKLDWIPLLKPMPVTSTGNPVVSMI